MSDRIEDETEDDRMVDESTELAAYKPELSTSKVGLTMDIEEEEVDTRCGFTSSCKPTWLQKCANVKVYLVLISLCSIIQGFAVNGINNVNITSYERRYLLTSSQSSLVASFYDISAGITVLFVGYFGATAHQPRILGMAVLSLALGTLLMSVAHFTAPEYDPGTRGTRAMTCSVNGTDVPCNGDDSQAFLKNYLYVLLFGQILNGFGGTCLYSIGVTYLDQSVSAKMSPLYIGLMSGSSILGPALGYIAGGYLLEIYVHPDKSDTLNFTSSSPAWIGAWWLGFVISSVFAFILAVFMFLFPKELPNTKAIRAAKVSEAHDNGAEDVVNSVGFGLTWRDMPKATWLLLKNPTFMCITGVVATELILASGMSTFLPKYVGNQFSQSASWSAMVTGFIAVPGAALGQVTGGYICKRLKLKLRGILKLTIISSVLVILVTPVLWARCSDTYLAGVSTNYLGSQGSPSLSSSCNNGCGCQLDIYSPVCADDVQYFSPCHAGCTTLPTKDTDGVDVYANCSCPNYNQGNMMENSTVTKVGTCEAKCGLLYSVFVPFGFLLMFFTFLMGAPMTVATLRVVPEKQRSFAVSVQWVFLRFLGSIPGPIIFGSMIDSSCSVWEDKCGTKGSCWVYNSYDMSMRIFILCIVLKVVSLILNVTGVLVYKPPPEKSAPVVETGQECVAANGHSNTPKE